MPGIGKPLHLRLFLEGIEVPVVSAQVTASVNAPAAASIQIVPIDEALDFHPRTMVHLFVLETGPGPKEGQDGVPFLPNYKLLFAGEVIAYQYQQTPQSRGLVLQCTDFSSYWDTAHAMAIEYGPNGNFISNTGALIGANVALFDDIVSQQSQRLVGWLRVPPGPKSPGLKTVSGLAGGIIKILEAMAGVPGHTKGVNDFFTVAQLRCRILEQITAEENDQTSERLLSVTVFDEWIRNGLQNMGQQVTFRDIMKLLFQYIYYECVPNPAAKFEEAKGERTQQLHSQIIRPDCWFAPPPVCNVIFPEQYVSLSYERNYIGEVTRVLVFLYNTLVGEPTDQVGELFSNRILAPNFLKMMKAASQGGEAGYRVLLPHEYHTGIVPRVERLPNTAAVSSRVEANGQRISWAQNVALFHFFKYRYAPRMAAVAGRLNYNVVCGFPAAVVRAPFIPTPSDLASGADTILKAPASFGAPEHLLGMVAYVSHNIDQQGGTTTVQMHHVRSHRGSDDEFMRIAQQQTGLDQTIRVVLDYDEILKSTATQRDKLLRFLAGVTPQTVPAASKPETVRRASTSSVELSEETTTVDGSGKKTGSKTGSKTVTSETTETASSTPPRTSRATFGNATGLAPSPAGAITRGHAGVFGDGVVMSIQVNNPDLVTDQGALDTYGNMFHRVTIYQKVTVPVEGGTPLESLFIPRSWFSPKYENDSIGEYIYQPFFGCWSVIDELRYQDKASSTPQPLSASPLPTVSATTGSAFVAELAAKASAKNARSIERALDNIAFLYGRVKSSDGDVEEFIRQYTGRGLATMEQVLGSETLRFDVDSQTGAATPKPGTGKVGFHTAAIHPELVNSTTKLAGLVTDLSLQLPRMGGVGKPSTIEAAYDVRKAKWDRVNAYRIAMMRSRGLQG